MGVKRHRKSTENEQKRALLTRNWYKSTLFEQVLKQGTGVRDRGAGGRIWRSAFGGQRVAGSVKRIS